MPKKRDKEQEKRLAAAGFSDEDIDREIQPYLDAVEQDYMSQVPLFVEAFEKKDSGLDKSDSQ
jgi:hypothetical protein